VNYNNAREPVVVVVVVVVVVAVVAAALEPQFTPVSE